MRIKEIFTEYNDNIEKTLKLDPLGFGIIWTYFAEQIFKGKISSVIWDVRRLNINLFNHYVIKNLIDSDNLDIRILFELNQKETIEKLLIILENMLLWSWYKDKANWDKKNLLGTSKAITIWKNNKINIDIYSTFEELEMLKKQKTTGIGGTHKGSFVNMGFFDFTYNNYLEDNIYIDVEKLIDNNKKAKQLFDKLIEFFKNPQIEDIPTKEYLNLFAKTEILSEYTREFWIEKLGLNEGEAKRVFENIDNKDAKELFNELKNESLYFEIITKLEPKLSYLDTLFNYLLFCDNKSVSSLKKEIFFEELSNLNFDKEIKNSSGSTKDRLISLNKVKNIDSLIEYHKSIMEERGYSPWLKIKDEKINVNIKSKEDKEKIEKKLKTDLKNIPWINNYYISSLKALKKGLLL